MKKNLHVSLLVLLLNAVLFLFTVLENSSSDDIHMCTLSIMRLLFWADLGYFPVRIYAHHIVVDILSSSLLSFASPTSLHEFLYNLAQVNCIYRLQFKIGCSATDIFSNRENIQYLSSKRWVIYFYELSPSLSIQSLCLFHAINFPSDWITEFEFHFQTA